MSLIKKRKNYYSAEQNKKSSRKKFPLNAGMTGFFCTCNFAEKDCIRDAYKILTEYSERNETGDACEDSGLGIKLDDSQSLAESLDETKDSDEDISTSLNKEISALKTLSAKSKFQVIDTGIKNNIFIKSSVSDPLKLVQPIMRDAYETKIKKSRYILRLLPIHLVCKAVADVIKSQADPLFDNYFVQDPKTFAIVFNRHSNSKIQRNDVIENLADLITKKNPANKVDLKNPELTVVVEIIRGFCLLSIAPNYFLYRKYNLTELCSTDTKNESKKDSSETETKGDKEVEAIKDEQMKTECEADEKKDSSEVEAIKNDQMEIELEADAKDSSEDSKRGGDINDSETDEKKVQTQTDL